MSEELPSHDDFFCTLPVWTVIDPEEFKQAGVPASIKLLNSPKFGLLLGLFTDEDLALRFIEDVGLTGRTTFKISAKEQLLDTLSSFKVIGVKYVGIDCPALASPRNETGRYPTLQQVIDAASAI
jgi:hypothetical protein